MEKIALATLLFGIYFSFFYWLLLEPITPATAFKRSPITTHQAIATSPTPPQEPDQFNSRSVVALAPTTAVLPITKITADTPKSLFDTIDKLQLRTARKIASKLGIKQKYNGKDAPLEELRREIRKSFEAQPQETTLVISQVLQAVLKTLR